MQALLSFILLQLSVLDVSAEPQRITIDLDREIPIKSNTRIVLDARPDLEQRATLTPLLRVLPFSPAIVGAREFDERDFAIRIGVVGEHPHFEARAVRRRLRDLPDLGPEGYQIHIERDSGVLLAGNTEVGVHRGLETLAALATQFGAQWPELEIRDAPALRIRAALLSFAPSETDLDALSAAQCNMLIFDHPDFQWLEGSAANTWRQVFREARERHIEPVPGFALFHSAEKLIARAPLAAEGRTAEDALVLRGTSETLLGKARPLIGARSARPEVRIGGVEFDEGADYRLLSLTDGPTPLWAIRRTTDSAIPDGATVTLRYAHAPGHSVALCPEAPEAREVLDEALARLCAELAPRYLYAGPGPVTRLNEDPRCHAENETDAQRIAAGLKLLHAIARKHAPGLRLIVEETAAFSGGAAVSWQGRGNQMPPGSLRLSTRATEGALAVCDSPSDAYTTARDALRAGAEGLLVRDIADPPSLAAALGRAWNPEALRHAWPEGLNAHFGASLWRPSFEARLEALVNFINAETRRGRSARDLRRDFAALYGALRRPLEGVTELDLTQTQFEVLMDYLELEAAYTEDPSRAAPGKVVDLVTRQAALDPRMDAQRVARIVETIENQGLFVPASILFGVSLDYLRPTPIPRPGNTVLPIPIRPTLRNLPNETTASMDLAGFPLTITRINFESVAAQEFRVSKQSDTTMQVFKPSATAVLRSPILPKQLSGPGIIDLTAVSGLQTAVLREIEVLAVKETPELRCPERLAPAKELPSATWSDTAEASGFVLTGGASFAEAPTIVRTARTRDALYFHIRAYEPRMHALAATHTRRDAPLWEDESVEIRLLPPDGSPVRLLVNPLGTIHDAQRGDTGWDGPWQVNCLKEADSWSALISIPFTALDAAPHGTWRVDFLRHRRNAIQEDSEWAPGGPERYGRMEFQ